MGYGHLHLSQPGLNVASLLTLLHSEQETGGEEHQSGVVLDRFNTQKEEGLVIGKRLHGETGLWLSFLFFQGINREQKKG